MSEHIPYMDDEERDVKAGDRGREDGGATHPALDVRWGHQYDDLLAATVTVPDDQDSSWSLKRSRSVTEDTSHDLLGVLSHTPDTDAPASHFDLAGWDSWSGSYRELRFTDFMPEVYLGNTPLRLSLIALEPLPATLHLFNQYRVVVELQHGCFRWQVHTRLKNITSLHNKLVLFRMKLRVPAATNKTRERRSSLRHQLSTARPEVSEDPAGAPGPQINGDVTSRQFKDERAVKYPRKSLARMDNDTPGDLQQYLRNMLLHPFYRSQRDVLNLFEVSALSFVRGLGRKLKEGLVKKRCGGYNKMYLACGLCDGCYGQYKERWMVLKETCLFFLTPSTGAVRSVMLMDQDFQVSSGFRHTGIKNGVVITSLSRRLAIMCDNDQAEKDWSAEIRKAQRHYAGDFCSGANKHGSFAPQRQGAMANWYVDGNRYMWDVADAVDQAREEVFITDWWLSPDIYMKRPDLTATHWKLSEVLKRAAARGVLVYVLLYKEVEMALGLNSLYTKHALDKMHPNIKVLRHPDHGGGGTLYWAHHEKIVVVDQQLAFVSGIDLCYGRWDDYKHRLVDLGHAGMQKQEEEQQEAGLSPEPKDHRSSHSSISQLVTGAQLMVSTVNTVSPPEGGSDLSLPTDVAARSSSAGPMGTSSPYSPFTGGDEGPSFSTIASPPRDLDDTSERRGNAVERPESSTGIPVSNPLRTRLHVPDIVDQVMKRQLKSRDRHNARKKAKAAKRDLLRYGAKDSSASDAEATSDDELYPFPDGRRPPSFSDATDSRHDPSGVHLIHGKPRSASDPLRKHKHRNILYKIAGSERRKNGMRRQKSLESLEGDEDLRRGQMVRRSGVKSDGDDLSGDEDRVDGKVKYVKDAGGTSRTMEAVRHRGRALVGEMRYRGSEMKNWTRRNVSRLHRAESLNSEADLELEEIATKSASKWRARVRATRSTKRNQDRAPTMQFDHAPTLYDSPSIHLWVGKDYVNWITKDLNNPDEPFTDSVERHRTPRMPWHDIGLYVEGPAARDVARHFVQRWNAVKTEKVKNNSKYPYLLPRTYDPGSFRQSLSLNKQRVRCQVVRSVGEWSGAQHDTERSIYNAYLDAIRESLHYVYIENQFFISSSGGGIRSEVQNRVAAALVERIVKAHRSKTVFRVFMLMPLLPAFEGQIGTPSGTAMQFILHYTYASITRGDNSLIRTLESRGVHDWRRYISFCSLRIHDCLDGRLVSELIYIHSKLLIVDDRLVIAGSANINDRSFLGDRDSEVALVIEDEEFEDGVMNGAKHQRGRFAGGLRRYLFSEHLGLIDPAAPKPSSFFDGPIGEGDNNNSSNANRPNSKSNCSSRKGSKKFQKEQNGQKSKKGASPGSVSADEMTGSSDKPPTPGGTTAALLRTAIQAVTATVTPGGMNSPTWRSSPPLSVKDIEDPVSDKFFTDVWQATARNNTAIYDDTFSCYPCDGARTFQDVERLRAAVPLAVKDPDAALRNLSALQGHLVEFPLHFLEHEALKPGLGTKESLLPNETWT